MSDMGPMRETVIGGPPVGERRLSFAVMRGVAKQFVRCQSSDFSL